MVCKDFVGRGSMAYLLSLGFWVGVCISETAIDIPRKGGVDLPNPIYIFRSMGRGIYSSA